MTTNYRLFISDEADGLPIWGVRLYLSTLSPISKNLRIFAQNTRKEMKKGLIFLIISLFSLSLFSQEWVNCGSQEPTAPSVKLLSNSKAEISVRFALGGFYKEVANTSNGLQYSITVPKMASMLEEGAPDLPLFAIPLLIDDQAEMDIQIKVVLYQDFENIEIAPSKGNFSREIDPESVPYHYGEVYTQNQFFPSHQAQLDKPYILRDYRGQNMLVYPFAYNPVTKTLRVYTEMVLSMVKKSDKGYNAKASRKAASKLAPETKTMYSHRFINFDESASKYPFVPDEGEMLVICPPAYLAAMQPFVDWKNESGRPTTLVNLSDIGGNDDDQIKSFILSHYNNPEENLCYVLLVGDYNDLTPHSLGGGCSDIWFGQLEGDDYYPEVFVGRFSAGSITDVQNQVAKVLYYERDMGADVTWLDKGMGIGSTEGQGSGHNGGESDYQHIDYIRDTLMHYTYEAVSQHYQGVGVGTNATMLSSDFNDGVGICNYCNHGTTTGWYVGSFSNSHVNALVNDYKWPFIWSTACYNGQFNVNCFAEAWMRATNDNTGAPTGAIGGMFSWISQPWQPPMTGQDEMVDILCEWRNADQFHHTFGGASLNGNMKILDLHPSDHGNTHNTWILFGDPSLMLRTDNPTELNVTCEPEAIFLGQTDLQVTADADYAIATLSIDGNILACTALTNGEGILTFASPETVGTAKLVVTSYNKVTEVKDIEIIPANGAFLSYDSFHINDENGQADYGETFTFDLTIKNIGNESASDVQVSLATDSPYIQINDGSAIIPNIEAQSHYTIPSGFEITVGENITDGIQANFTLICSDGEHTWTSHFRMTLHAPALSIVDFRPSTTINPGEPGELIISVKNATSSDAHDVTIQLYSSSTDLNFSQITYPIGSIPAGSIATITPGFSTSPQIPVGSSFEVYYLLEALPISKSGIEQINIGPIKETFETGDFSAFDWESLGGAQWFVDNSTANTGIYSARSGAINHTNITTLQVEMNVTEAGQISFYKKISSEANKDKLTFYIDSDAKGEWSGEVSWSREIFPVNAGTHKFKWIYMKNGSGSYGDDCCWIDDVLFPSTNMVSFLPALEVNVQTDLNEVTLSWESYNPSDNYIIRRNGEQVSIQHETTFTDICELGTYIYSVTAYRNENQFSIPAFVEVEIDTIGIPEISNEVQLFPNPAHTTLNISLGKPFDYIIYNRLGQQVSMGSCSGATQINCSHLSQGLYFIQIITKGQAIQKKILIL